MPNFRSGDSLAHLSLLIIVIRAQGQVTAATGTCGYSVRTVFTMDAAVRLGTGAPRDVGASYVTHSSVITTFAATLPLAT